MLIVHESCISSALALRKRGIVTIASLRFQFQPFSLPLACELHRFIHKSALSEKQLFLYL